jgi:hypothetical protein
LCKHFGILEESDFVIAYMAGALRAMMAGNPTKSVEVNDFIKRVKKLEARKQGAESQTCQPMLETEL